MFEIQEFSTIWSISGMYDKKSGPVRTAFPRYIKSGFVRKLFYRVHVLDQLKHFV